MRIRKRLQFHTTISLLTALVICLLLFLALQRIGRANAATKTASDLMSCMLERETFGNDFIRNGTARAGEQWLAKQRQIGALLDEVSTYHREAEERTTVEGMIQAHRSIDRLFSAMVRNRERGGRGAIPALSGAVEERLLSQLNMRTYEEVLAGRMLLTSSRRFRDSVLRQTGGGIVAALLLLASATLATSWNMGRVIGDRIGLLREGAAIIGDGALEHRIEIRGDDEFAELAAAFNAMTAKLRGSYRQLEDEVAGRRRGEEALKEAHNELARQVEERTRDLAEKEVLLKEIHHRVKNNLQVISSLVSLQADASPDGTAREVLKDVTDRVRSMALVHEKLYRSSDLARIDFAEYSRGLLGYLWRAHGAIAASVRLELDLEPLPLPVDSAVPCGLILNELAGNALKHAFRGRDGGTVTVALKNGGDGRVSLVVADDGIGLPRDLEWRRTSSLGLRLVQMLSGQLDAAVTVTSGAGTRFEISFGDVG